MTCVFYESDWHTRVWKLSPAGTNLDSTHLEGVYLSGWRIATDQRGHVYVGAMEYGESGIPLVIELDTDLREVGRFGLPEYSSVFVDSLQVTPDGKSVTLGGSAYRQWLGKPTHGVADAFAIRFKRADTSPAPAPEGFKTTKKPGKAREEQFPW